MHKRLPMKSIEQGPCALPSDAWQRWNPQCHWIVCVLVGIGRCGSRLLGPLPAAHDPTGSGATAPAAAHAIPCCLALPPLAVWCHPQCPWPHWHPPALAAPSQGGNSCCAQVAPGGACMVGLCPPPLTCYLCAPGLGGCLWLQGCLQQWWQPWGM